MKVQVHTKVERVPAPECVTEEKPWFIAVVTTNKWRVAAKELEGAGMIAFNPLSVRKVHLRGKDKAYEKPVMPGYMFVSPKEGYPFSLRGLDGVVGYLSINGAPAIIPWEAVKRIVDYLALPVETVARVPVIGDCVKVIAGTMEGYRVVVASVDGADITAEAFGKRLKIPVRSIELAA